MPGNALASTQTTPQPTPPQVSMFQGQPVIVHTTPAEVAYAADKQKVSNEYVQLVLSGKESMTVYETHYKVFMAKWHLGNSANLHNVLMKTASKQNKLTTMTTCPSVANGPYLIGCPPTPTNAAQFPEENWNWCGPATMATTLVEDSFAWSGTNSYNGFTVSYDPYVTSQAYTTAYNDELGLINNDGLISPYPYGIWQDGAGPNDMLRVANAFISGKGGQYAPMWSNSNFQNNIVSDIATGWDVPTGLYLPPRRTTLPGYPIFTQEVDHWVPVTFDTNGGATVYYADPTYKSPAYTNWTTPGPYASTATSNMAQYVPFYLW